jgi:hypothetical protein
LLRVVQNWYFLQFIECLVIIWVKVLCNFWMINWNRSRKLLKQMWTNSVLNHVNMLSIAVVFYHYQFKYLKYSTLLTHQIYCTFSMLYFAFNKILRKRSPNGKRSRGIWTSSISIIGFGYSIIKCFCWNKMKIKKKSVDSMTDDLQ